MRKIIFTKCEPVKHFLGGELSSWNVSRWHKPHISRLISNTFRHESSVTYTKHIFQNKYLKSYCVADIFRGVVGG